MVRTSGEEGAAETDGNELGWSDGSFEGTALGWADGSFEGTSLWVADKAKSERTANQECKGLLNIF